MTLNLKMISADTSKTLLENKKLASLFRELSDCYSYLGNEERFRARAYLNASKTIDNLDFPISNYRYSTEKLDELKYIGKSITEKIIEFIDTGKIVLIDKLRKKIPIELLQLTQKEGIGSKTIRKLHDTMRINSMKELRDKIEKGKLKQVKGFGKVKITLLSNALNSILGEEKRWPLQQAIVVGNKMIEELKKIPEVQEAILVGSIRRKKATIGDIDILVVGEIKNHSEIINKFSMSAFIKRVILKGRKKASFILKENEMQVDVRIFDKEEYPTALLYFTGPKEHNISLRSHAKKVGFKLNEYALYEIGSGMKKKAASEAEIYKLLKCNYQSPENRSGILKINFKTKHIIQQ